MASYDELTTLRDSDSNETLTAADLGIAWGNPVHSQSVIDTLTKEYWQSK